MLGTEHSQKLNNARVMKTLHSFAFAGELGQKIKSSEASRLDERSVENLDGYRSAVPRSSEDRGVRAATELSGVVDLNIRDEEVVRKVSRKMVHVWGRG